MAKILFSGLWLPRCCRVVYSLCLIYMVQWLIKKTVHEALTDSRWIQDIQRAIIVAVLIEYLRLHGLISEVVVQLDRERERTHIWQLQEVTPQSLHMRISSLVLFISDHGRGFRRVGHLTNESFSCG